jgi:hypothetical protein
MKFVLLFIDGLGIGENDPDNNPCTKDDSGVFRVFENEASKNIPFNGVSKGLDATLGIAGLPQSATGQTALLTGINASELLGYHLSGFPNKVLREILLKHSILRQAVQVQKKAAFINAFRPLFFELPENLILRLSATTIANYAAKLPFFRIEDIVAKRSIYQDFTNISLLERGFEVPIYSADEAADILANALDKFDFILYEYFQTDKVGHEQNMPQALEEIDKLGHFVHRFLTKIDLKNTCVILTSDHGNIEDLTTKSHTRNLALTLIWGPNNTTISERLHSIVDVTPTLVNLMKKIY